MLKTTGEVCISVYMDYGNNAYPCPGNVSRSIQELRARVAKVDLFVVSAYFLVQGIKTYIFFLDYSTVLRIR